MAKLVKIVSWRKFPAVQYPIIGDTCQVVIVGLSMYDEHAIY